MDNKELSVGFGDLEVVAYYSDVSEVKKFREGVAGGPNVRVVSGPKRYYLMKRYEEVLALISDLQGEEDYLGSVDARIKALKATKFTDLTPPLPIKKEGKGISLHFKQGEPVNFVTEKQYMAALRVLDELYARKKGSPAAAQEATPPTLERIVETAESPIAESYAEPKPDLKSEYGRIINLLIYTLEEVLYKPLRKTFVDAERRKISDETKRELEIAAKDMIRGHKQQYGGSVSKETDQEAIERYVGHRFQNAFEEKLKRQITGNRVDWFVEKKMEANYAVAFLHRLMNEPSPKDNILRNVTYEFFTAFFDYVKNSLSSHNIDLPLQRELILIANSDMTRDFLKLMYSLAKDKNRGSMYNKGREEYERIAKGSVPGRIFSINLSGEDITNIIRIVAEMDKKNKDEKNNQDGSIFLGGAEPDQTQI